MGTLTLKTTLRKVGFAEEKKDAYVTSLVLGNRISKEELLERAADNSGIKKGVMYEAADAIGREIRNFVVNGHAVEVPELGTFRARIRAHAVDTQEDAGANSVYHVGIAFYPSVALKDDVSKVSLKALSKDILTTADDKPEPTNDANNG